MEPMATTPMTQAAPPMAGQTGAPPITQTTQVIAPQDRVRWGPVWAGLISTFTVFLVLELLFYSVGALTMISSTGAVSAANPWITAIIGIIAFFVGGAVAEASSAVRGFGAGILNGLMVWGLGVTLIVLLSVFGLSSLFGAVGTAASGFLAGGHTIGLGSVNVTGSQVVHNAQAVALGAFFTLIVAAIAAALGGFVVARGAPIGRLTRR